MLPLPQPLAAFTADLAQVLAHPAVAPFPCPDVAVKLAVLIADDCWLAAEWRTPSAESYRRQCLYQSPDGAFSIGCFVWSPHQATPIHDHRAWGVIGVLAGSITSESFSKSPSGLIGTAPQPLAAGSVAWVHPAEGDIHRIGGGEHGGISIHVYGCGFDTVCLNAY